MKAKNKKFPTIILNSIKCEECDEQIISHTRHDFVSCKCGAVSCDGGKDYCKRGFKTNSRYTDMSVWSNAPFEIIRKSLYRGGYGKDGTEDFKYTLLKDMSNDWLDNVCIYNIENGLDAKYNEYYIRELAYRTENKIYIED
jgi:hypothetical protein